MLASTVLIIGLGGFIFTTAALAGPASKVDICHYPPDNPANHHTISVPEKAVDAHFAHGDTEGACGDSPEPIDGGWSEWSECFPDEGSCGLGMQYRTCTNPEPQNGGAPCEGDDAMSCEVECESVVQLFGPDQNFGW